MLSLVHIDIELSGNGRSHISTIYSLNGCLYDLEAFSGAYLLCRNLHTAGPLNRADLPNCV